MARSVSTPRGAVHVAFASYDSEDSDDFQWYMDDFAATVCKAFPSTARCDDWPGREDHALAQNGFAQFGVSEYCGLVAMWVLPLDDDYATSTGLRDRWIDSIGPKFRKIAGNCFGVALNRVGSASNGEAFFQPADGEQRGQMGLGFTSKEGWL